MEKIGIDIADVAATKDYVSSVTLVQGDANCHLNRDPVDLQDFKTSNLYHGVAVSIALSVLTVILLSIA